MGNEGEKERVSIRGKKGESEDWNGMKSTL